MDELPISLSSSRGSTPSIQLGGSELKRLAGVMQSLVQMGHKKMTTQQVLFFLGVAHGSAMGHSVNLSAIRETYAGIGRSIEKSIVQFLPATARVPDALGWVEQVEDPNDRRVKFLSLTPRGAEVAAALLVALRQ